MTISSDRILENIYGVTATGTIQNNLSGGNIRRNYVDIYKSNFRDRSSIIKNNNNIKYIDNESINKMNLSGGRKQSKSTTKKQRGSSTAPTIIYASPEYVKDSDLQTYMDKLFLYYRMSRSPNSAIYIIPPSSVLKDMISKRGDGAEGSIELQKSVINNQDILWRKYFFITYGDNSKNDKYRIDPSMIDTSAYPNKPFDEIRRTNLLGEVFYISYKDSSTVYINSKPGQKSGTQLKFVARFNNGGYIFKGEVPKESIEHIEPKNANKQQSKYRYRKFNELTFGELPFIGGNMNTSFDTLQQYDNIYNNDHELAAEHFIRCFAKKNNNNKYYNNGDMLFNALYYAVDNPNSVNVGDIGNEINDEEFQQLFNKYTPTANTRVEQFHNLTKKLNKLYNTHVRDKNNSKPFINAVNNIYKNISDKNIPIVDIMTGYVRNHEKVNYNQIYKDIYDTMTTESTDCQTCSAINNAISSNTLPSLAGRSSMPVFCSLRGGSFETDIKQQNISQHNNEDKNKKDNEDKNIVGDIFNACPCEKTTEQPQINDTEVNKNVNDIDNMDSDIINDDEVNDSDSDDIDGFFDDD